VYDVSGREVATLVDTFEEAGKKSVTFDGAGLANGLYLCRLRAGNQVLTRKLVVQR
jgi:hypothetical protein